MADINKDQLSELLHGNINDFIKNNLTKDQQNNLNVLLNDKEATEKLLSSSQAKEIFSKIFNKQERD